MTVEQIAACQPTIRDDDKQQTTIGVADLDDLCITARAGVRLSNVIRGYILHAERHGDGEQSDIKALRQFLKIAGFEP